MNFPAVSVFLHLKCLKVVELDLAINKNQRLVMERSSLRRDDKS